RLDFAGFHIWLIERIDPDDRAGRRRSGLPAKKFLREIVDVRNGNTDKRMARRRDLLDRSILRWVGGRLQSQVSEHSIVAVDVWGAERLSIDWNHTFAIFACRFRNQLFEPCAQIIDPG